MQPLALLGAMVSLWVLLHFWVLPLARQRWKAESMRGKMTRAGTLAVIDKARDMAGAGAIGVTVVVVLVLVGMLFGDSDTVWPKAVIDSLARFHSVAKGIAEGYGATLGWIGVAGAAIALWITAKTAKERVASVWMDSAATTFEALRSDPSQIEAARAIPSCAPLVAAIDDVLVSIHRVRSESPVNQRDLETAQDQLGKLLSSLAIEKAGANVDFLDAAGTPTEGESAAAAPAGWLRRLANLVSSDRFSKDLGLAGTWVSRAVIAFLFIALTGWSAAPLADSLRVGLNNLRMQMSEREAQRALDEALSLSASDTDSGTRGPTSPAVQRASAQLARAAINHAARGGMLDSIAGVARSREAETEFVRAALLGQKPPASTDPHGLIRADVATHQATPAGTDSPPSVRRAESLTEQSLAALERKDPARFARLAEWIDGRYGTPMTPLDAQSKLVAKIIDEAASAVDLKPEGELGKQAQKLGKDFGKKSIKAWADAAVKQFIADALNGTTRSTVLSRAAFESSAEMAEFVRELAAREGRGWLPDRIDANETRIAGNVAEEVSKLHRGAEEWQLAALRDRLGGYGQLFPPDQGPLPPGENPLGAPPAVGGGGGGGDRRAPAPAGERAHPSATRASPGHTASTNFRAALRSFRVRGVIIGHELEGTDLDLSDLRWTLVPPRGAAAATRIELEIKITTDRKQNPSWRSVGTFDAGVVNQAIRYAADRRVVAATITGGDAKAIRRLTYLHPVLVDTPLGCRIVESDRWVDTFSAPSAPASKKEPMAALAADRASMYAWMGAIELFERVSAQSPGECPRARLEEVVRRGNRNLVAFSAALDKELTAFMSKLGREHPGSERLVQQGDACARGPAAEFVSCLCKAYGRAPQSEYYFPEDHTSQVRERPPRLTADLQWLTGSPDFLGQFDFWTHTTFSLRIMPTGISDESRTTSMDFPVTHLKALRDTVVAQLPGYVQSRLGSGSYVDFMRPLEEFVLAQRLARAALTGRLGRDFPVSRLLDLEKATRSYVPFQPTIRWEAVETSDDLRRILGRADSTALSQYDAYEKDIATRVRDKRPLCDKASG